MTFSFWADTCARSSHCQCFSLVPSDASSPKGHVLFKWHFDGISVASLAFAGRLLFSTDSISFVALLFYLFTSCFSTSYARTRTHTWMRTYTHTHKHVNVHIHTHCDCVSHLFLGFTNALTHTQTHINNH